MSVWREGNKPANPQKKMTISFLFVKTKKKIIKEGKVAIGRKIFAKYRDNSPDGSTHPFPLT